MEGIQSHDEKVAEALEQYLAAYESGQAASRSAFLAQNPDIADDLAACLDSLEFIEQSTLPLPASAALEPGQQFGEYRILREIGRGGMGVVYEAFHTSLERRVALKVLSRRDLKDERHRERFIGEAKTAAQLHHTNIVPVFEVGELGEVCYYAMQFIEGTSLGKIVRHLRAGHSWKAGSETEAAQAGSLATPAASAEPAAQGTGLTGPDVAPEGSPRSTGSWDRLAGGPSDAIYFRESARLIAQAADALSYAHRRGVVHRDIKPSNLLVDAAGTVWITDFGLAFRPEDSGYSNDGEVVGTPLYMSPEQASPQGAAIGYRTDIYSLGATLYELLTLRPMFESKNSLSLLEQIRSAAPAPPRRFNRRIPRDLESVVQKSTSKRPEDRYGDAAALGSDLRHFANHEPVSARPLGLVGHLIRWCRRQPAIAAVTAVSTILLTAVIFVSYWAILGGRNQAIEARDIAQEAEDVARDAERRARENLWEALRQNARATLLSFPPGRRWAALELIEQARAIRFDRVLRDEAIAALSITDARLQSRLPVGEVVRSIAFCPDGQQLVCGSGEGTIRIWDLQGDSEQPVVLTADPELLEGSSSAGRVVVSSCGRFLASTQGEFIELWDVQSQRLIDSLELEEGFRPRFLAFLPEPTNLVALSEGGLCQQWKIQEGNLELTADHDLADLGVEQCIGATLGPDRKSITLLDGSGTITVWDLGSGEHRQIASGAQVRARWVSIDWDPRGKVLAVVQDRGVVDLWEAGTSDPVASLAGHRGRVVALAFNADGTILATSGYYEPSLKLWDVATGELITTLTTSSRGLRSACFSPDGGLLAAGGQDETVSLWEIVSPSSYRKLPGHDEAVTRAALSPDGKYAAAGSLDGDILLWQLSGNQDPVRFTLESEREPSQSWSRAGECRGLAFSDDGQLLAARSLDKTIRVWDVGSQSLVAQLRSRPVWGGGGPVFLPGEPELLLAAGDTIYRWEIGPDKRPVTVAVTSGPIRSLDTDPQRKLVAACVRRARGESLVEVFEITSGRLLTDPFRLPASGRTVAFSPDGRLLAVGDYNGGVHLFSLETGSHVRGWNESADAIAQLSFSPDGQLLLVAGRSGLIRLLALPSGDLVAELPGHAGGARAASFSRDGTILITCGEDKLVHVWQLHGLRRELAKLGLDW